MAKVKKCGRCGAFYMPYNTTEEDSNKPNCIKWTRSGRMFVPDKTVEYSELCPDCMELMWAIFTMFQTKKKDAEEDLKDD